ncbi:vWA domain-containing protein, partial [Leucobacter sp. M11]|uniref:vWA domain-containing protein n=1 Tax=Leucobacter sp. M11 TaxID=2993565 RepID=UPI002D7E6DB6
LSEGSAAAALAEYRRRLGGYRAEIEGTREAWRRVLGNAAEDRLVPGRAASAEGETLHTGRLAATVTEVSAGRTRPDAFRVRARVSRSARAPGHTDYALVLDRSASMRGRNAQLCGDAAMVMVEALEAVSRDVAQAAVRPRAALAPQLRAALIVFDAAPVTVKPLARPLDEAARAGLHAAVRGAGGSTLGAPALREAARELGLVTAASRPTPAAPGDPRRIVILVSDGGVTDAAELRGEASALRRAGADVVGIGVGAGAGLAELGIEARRIERLDQLPGALAGLLAEHAHPSPRGAASGSRA